MVFVIKKINAIYLIVLFIICFSNGSDTIKTIDPRLAGWKFKSKFVPSLALIKSIEDNHKIIKYWEIGCGGAVSSSYVVLRTSAELDTFWQNLMTKVKLDKPDVDFSKNILLFVQPGICYSGFKYKIAVTEKHDLIQVKVSNYLVGSRSRLLIGAGPIFAFEIPAPPLSKKISIQFDRDSRSYGIQPK